MVISQDWLTMRVLWINRLSWDVNYHVSLDDMRTLNLLFLSKRLRTTMKHLHQSRTNSLLASEILVQHWTPFMNPSYNLISLHYWNLIPGSETIDLTVNILLNTDVEQFVKYAAEKLGRKGNTTIHDTITKNKCSVFHHPKSTRQIKSSWKNKWFILLVLYSITKS